MLDDDEPSRLLVGVLGGLARALLMRGEHRRGADVRARAVTAARELGDRAALAGVLAGAAWARGTEPPERILAELTEARELAEALGDAELGVDAMFWRATMLLSLAELGAARREVTEVRALAGRTAQPFQIHSAEQCESAIALCEGRLADAEAAAQRSHEWSTLLTGREESGVFGIQMFGVRREQGRLAEVAPVIRLLAGGAGDGSWRPGLVSLLAEIGLEEEAASELARIAADGLDGFRASLWLASLTFLTDAAAALGDRAAAALLYPELEPYGGTNVVIGNGVACYGAADRFLGMLAATLGDAPLAERHFGVALALNRRMGARTWVARTAYEHGRMLRTRGDRARAAELLGEARDLAREIGMPTLLDRIDAAR